MYVTFISWARKSVFVWLLLWGSRLIPRIYCYRYWTSNCWSFQSWPWRRERRRGCRLSIDNQYLSRQEHQTRYSWFVNWDKMNLIWHFNYNKPLKIEIMSSSLHCRENEHELINIPLNSIRSQMLFVKHIYMNERITINLDSYTRSYTKTITTLHLIYSNC